LSMSLSIARLFEGLLTWSCSVSLKSNSPHFPV
jgi:hypothetical protein